LANARRSASPHAAAFSPATRGDSVNKLRSRSCAASSFAYNTHKKSAVVWNNKKKGALGSNAPISYLFNAAPALSLCSHFERVSFG
jgi:hypothetical protein